MVHLVKTGLMGLVGRFRSVDHRNYPRDLRVICRTERGLEYGEIICAVEQDCLLYTSPSPRDKRQSRMPSSA